MQNPYGNYVIQYILDTFDYSEVSDVYNSICGAILPLSCQKFASNVVEKCFANGPAEIHEKYLAELLAPPNPGQASLLGALIGDCYGNYILQRAMSSFSRENATILCEKLLPILNLKENASRRLISKIRKMFPGLLIPPPQQILVVATDAAVVIGPEEQEEKH